MGCCVAAERKRTSVDVDKFINHLNENLANPKSMDGTDKIFKNMVDNKYGEITPESLYQEFKTLDDPLKQEELRYLMDIVSRPGNGINLDNEEFYYIMTKKANIIDDLLAISKLSK